MKNKTNPMKVFAVSGVSTSGKTPLVEEIVKELVKRGYGVGTIKSIGGGRGSELRHDGSYENHGEMGFDFTIDTAGKDSFRHRRAGAEKTGTWAIAETALIYHYRFGVDKLIENYNCDYLVIEGGKDYPLPKINTGYDLEDIRKVLGKTTFAISGKVADKFDQVDGIRTFRTFDDIEALVDLIEEKVQPAIGYKDYKGCKMCGFSCEEMNAKILAGEKSYLDCKRAYPEIELNCDNPELKESFRKALVALDIPEFPEKFKIEF